MGEGGDVFIYKVKVKGRERKYFVHSKLSHLTSKNMNNIHIDFLVHVIDVSAAAAD